LAAQALHLAAMAPDSWQPQILFAAALVAALLLLVYAKALVPIADHAQRAQAPRAAPDDEVEREPAPRARRFPSALAFAVLLTAAVRLGVLAMLHR
jgi:hypothetical protein